ncbi:MAG: hypothetical protein IBJ09_02695 [Bacteroidia bacterium]|nr:hypothetical protein [Bacteroidia bacterium]
MRKLCGLLGLALLASVSAHTYAQDTTKTAFRRKIPNYVEPRKHELRLNGGPMAGQMVGFYGDRGVVLSADYARGFVGQHYLRVGLRINDIDYRNFGGPIYPPISPNPSVVGGDSSSYSMMQTQTKLDVLVNTHAGITIGYEKAIGLRKVKFIIGADLYAGYHALKLRTDEAMYLETRTYDPATQLFDYSYNFTAYGNTVSTDRRIVLGVIPRIGVRWQITPFFGLGLALNPLVGYSHRVSGKEVTSGDRPQNPGALKGYWFFQQNLEGSLIFSFAKRNPGESRK